MALNSMIMVRLDGIMGMRDNTDEVLESIENKVLGNLSNAIGDVDNIIKANHRIPESIKNDHERLRTLRSVMESSVDNMESLLDSMLYNYKYVDKEPTIIESINYNGLSRLDKEYVLLDILEDIKSTSDYINESERYIKRHKRIVADKFNRGLLTKDQVNEQERFIANNDKHVEESKRVIESLKKEIELDTDENTLMECTLESVMESMTVAMAIGTKIAIGVIVALIGKLIQMIITAIAKIGGGKGGGGGSAFGASVREEFSRQAADAKFVYGLGGATTAEERENVYEEYKRNGGDTGNVDNSNTTNNTNSNNRNYNNDNSNTVNSHNTVHNTNINININNGPKQPVNDRDKRIVDLGRKIEKRLKSSIEDDVKYIEDNLITFIEEFNIIERYTDLIEFTTSLIEYITTTVSNRRENIEYNNNVFNYKENDYVLYGKRPSSFKEIKVRVDKDTKKNVLDKKLTDKIVKMKKTIMDINHKNAADTRGMILYMYDVFELLEKHVGSADVQANRKSHLKAISERLKEIRDDYKEMRNRIKDMNSSGQITSGFNLMDDVVKDMYGALAQSKKRHEKVEKKVKAISKHINTIYVDVLQEKKILDEY